MEMALYEVDPKSEIYAELLDVRKASLRARDLTMKLLAFARKEKMEQKVVSINSILEDIVDIVRRGGKPAIRVETNYCKDKLSVKVDTNQVFQALFNICNNAIDAMEGGGSLIIETAFVDDEETALSAALPKMCLVRISDTGPGIPEDVVPKIFEPFFTTKERGKGTGLGLSTALGIIENHGGHINVSSGIGDGTSVEVFLPISDEPLDSEALDGPGGILYGSETVLVVDDEMSVLETSRIILRKAGYVAVSAGDGAEAVDLFKGLWDQVSLVIMDIIMPGMSCEEIFLKIRKIDKNVPVVFMSGFSEGPEVSRILETEDMVFFIQKPFEAKDFLKLVRRAIRSREESVQE